jgi:hypothetical protein
VEDFVTAAHILNPPEKRVDEPLSFAVFHLNTMLLRLKKKYKAGLLGKDLHA